MKNLLNTTVIFILILFCIPPAKGYAQNASAFRLRGYIKDMPSVQLDRNFGDPSFGNTIHNRLNFRWDISSNFDLTVEGRNRLFYSEMLRDIPGVKSIFEHDPGLADMSWVWLSDGAWLGHSMIDRLFVSWRREDWRVRVGRQRVNWGVNLVSNPNDLFNVYSFFDFDYTERPGTDAVRIQRYLSHLSSIELAVSPARHTGRMVAAAKMSLNMRGYDMQAIAGYFRNRLALGGGWAGNLKTAGFKGELTWFYDIEETQGVDRGNIVAAAGLDYMFSNGTFAVIELLYNGGHARESDAAILITEPLRPDNIMFSEFALTISADHPFSPILGGGITVMALPDIEALFFMPNLKYSIFTDLDLELVAQIFTGGKGTIFEAAGSAFYASFQYSF